VDGMVIKAVLTDCDGVLTDAGVYYGSDGEVLKRFSIRDGMGFERLRDAGLVVGIVSGERSPSLVARAEKLQVTELHLGISDKVAVVDALCERHGLVRDEVAFIGDDVNDVPVMRAVGLSGTPADAMPAVRAVADVVCDAPGGQGAFRDFAEAVLDRLGWNENRYERPEETA
jgi:3-deoxy-D-manno-octulosonate 8-phosphate phosphatase (KDO 8-P phosphatase)